MDSLSDTFISFFIWFFTWQTLQIFMESKKIYTIPYNIVGLVIAILVYSYFNNLDKEDNECSFNLSIR